MISTQGVQNDESSVALTLNKLNSFSILIPSKINLDLVAASTSLYLALIKLGKSTSLSCEVKVEENLKGADKFSSTIVNDGENLIISFPYQEGSIDKVDYNINNGSFNLVIVPREGFPKITPNQVSFSYTGNNVDGLIIIGSPTLQSLGSLYTNNKELFTGRELINIDLHFTNNQFGTVNYINKSSASLSEMVFKIIKQLKIEVDKDIATNLYTGILSATKNFTSYSVKPETLEIAAELLKLGAVKRRINTQQQGFKPSTRTQQNSLQTNTFGSLNTNINKGFNTNQPSQPTNSLANTQPQTKTFNQKPIENVEKTAEKESPPTDWLKPKIFKGGKI